MASLIKRGSIYYLQYSLNGIVRRISTGTDIFQLAKEKQLQYESARLRSEDNPLPMRHERIAGYIGGESTVGLYMLGSDR